MAALAQRQSPGLWNRCPSVRSRHVAPTYGLRSSADRAPAFYSGGRWFESSRGHIVSEPGTGSGVSSWPRGKAAVCKAAYTGSIPVEDSIDRLGLGETWHCPLSSVGQSTRLVSGRFAGSIPAVGSRTESDHSGYSAAWERAPLGQVRPQVQILLSRLVRYCDKAVWRRGRAANAAPC